MSEASNLLFMWVIYKHPKDHPDSYVVRRWAMMSEGKLLAEAEPWGLCETLGDARGLVPEGLQRRERDDCDDPVIVEMWL